MSATKLEFLKCEKYHVSKSITLLSISINTNINEKIFKMAIDIQS